MAKIIHRVLMGRAGQIMTRFLVGLTSRVAQVPSDVRHNMLQFSDGGEQQLDAVAVSTWMLRHRFKFRRDKTRISPVPQCKALADAEFCISLIETSSTDAVGENTLTALKDFKTALRDEKHLGALGRFHNRQLLIGRIDNILRTYIVENPEAAETIGASLRYEVEDRSADDEAVKDLVMQELTSTISNRLVEVDEKLSKHRRPHDLLTAINLQNAADKAGIELFICADSLLALMRDGAFCLGKRRISFGIIADAELFGQLKQWASGLLEYEQIESPAPDDLLILQTSGNAPTEIWRHQREGAYLSRRDAFRVWYNRYFETTIYMFDNLGFRVPSNWEHYLAEGYGYDWTVPKLISLSGFDNRNTAYVHNAETLNYLTTHAIKSLREGHRLGVERCFEDMADYFGLDYTAYVPVKNFYVDTPAGRRRKQEREDIEKIDTGYVLCSGAGAITAQSLTELERLARKHERLVAVQCPKADKTSKATVARLSHLKMFDDVLSFDAANVVELASEPTAAAQIYNFDLTETEIETLPTGMLPLQPVLSNVVDA